MSASLSPSGLVTARDTVEISPSQQVKLFARVRRREWAFKATGALLLAACGLLTWLLVHDPLGAVPGAEGFWKGAPMILGAAFMGIYGALVMLLRRFSLGATIAAMLLAACFAAGSQAYVQTIEESDLVEPLGYQLPADKIDPLLAATQSSLTEKRLRALPEELHAAGILEEPPAFNRVGLAFGAEGGRVQVAVRFDFSPFVHSREGPSRYIAILYASAICDVYVEEVAGRGVVEGADAAERIRSLTHYLSRRYSDRFATRAAAAAWLAAREKDPQVRERLERYRDENR